MPLPVGDQPALGSFQLPQPPREPPHSQLHRDSARRWHFCTRDFVHTAGHTGISAPGLGSLRRRLSEGSLSLPHLHRDPARPFRIGPWTGHHSPYSYIYRICIIWFAQVPSPAQNRSCCCVRARLLQGSTHGRQRPPAAAGAGLVQTQVQVELGRTPPPAVGGARRWAEGV